MFWFALPVVTLSTAPSLAEPPASAAVGAPRVYPPHVVRNFERAMRQAEKGDPVGQLSVGSAYYGGAGVPQDFRKAAEWFNKAAQQGNYAAQRNLKIMAMSYRGGVNPTTLAEMAKTWRLAAAPPQPRAAAPRQPKPDEIFRDNMRGARKGEIAAIRSVGAAYYLGQGVGQDRAVAAEWYTKAAALGDRDAQAILGMMHARGEGVARNPVEAVRLYTQAAEQGSERAQLALAIILRDGRDVPRNDEAAVRWYRQLAQHGFANAQFFLAESYAAGAGQPASPNDAYFWADVASDHLDAASTLTGLTASSTPSREQAISLRDTAAVKLTTAQLADARAHAALWKAAVRRDQTAQLALAERYLNGSGCAQNLPEAYRWVSLAMGPPIIAQEDLPTTKPYNERRDALLARRDRLEARLSAEQLIEAKRLTNKGLPVGRITQR